MKKLILFVFICANSVSVFSQTGPKAEKIQKLLELTGSGKVGAQVAKQMIVTFQKTYPKVDQKIWDELANEIKAEDLIALMIPIYDKYYTEDDVDQLIVFYNTPIGKKSTEVLPAISQESMAAGQAWGRKIGEKIAQKLKEKGY